MHVRQVPALSGWGWVKEGFQLMARQPMALIGLTVLFVLTIVLPTILPVIGGFAPLLLTPALSVGFMQAVRTAERGERPAPLTLYDGLRGQRGRSAAPLLLLGLINCVLTVSVLALSMLADGGTLFRIATGAIGNNDPGLSDGSLMGAALIFGLLFAPVQMAMWFAPMFVAWHGMHPIKALFYSLVAVWRNRWAFLLYTLGWFGVAVLASMLIQVAKSLLGGTALTLLMSPLSLAMLCALYCSFWPTYRDLIVTDQATGTSADGMQPIQQ
jgi:hypothetical protein